LFGQRSSTTRAVPNDAIDVHEPPHA
jgi:hypothetical protein